MCVTLALSDHFLFPQTTTRKDEGMWKKYGKTWLFLFYLFFVLTGTVESSHSEK